MGAHPDRHCKAQAQMTTCKWGLYFRLGLPRGLSDKQAPYQCRKQGFHPRPGRPPTPWSSSARTCTMEPALCSWGLNSCAHERPARTLKCPRSPWATGREAPAMSSPRSPQPEKSLSSNKDSAQRQRKKLEAGGRFP